MIRLLSLFSGIGAFESALCRGGYQFETVNYCEIDPYAAKAYSQIHDIPEEKNLHDVRQVNTLLMDNINLMTWGWPCQDISVAGKQRGFTDSDGNRTRSGLFFEGLRILETLQPEYAIAENVKALTGKKFTAEFETVLTSLDKAGYNNYWEVLNAKDYGIPQNRERIFIISIRKDIDTGTFTFPEKQELKLRVKDVLEPVVDEKYYIDNERSRNLIQKIKITEPIICRSVGRDPDNPSNREKGCNTEQTLELKKDGMSNTLTTVHKDNLVLVAEPKIKNIGSINGHQSGNVLHQDSDLSPCLLVAGHVEPLKIMQVGNIVDNKNFGNPQRGRIYSPEGLSPALNTVPGGGLEPKFIENKVEYRIRKLTPRECFRLMGFTDNDFDKIHGISNTQLYKMAGNSIVVNVLEAIFKQLFKESEK